MLAKIHILLTIIIWVGTLCAYAFYRLTKSKIDLARSIEDMADFQCSSAKKRINIVKKFRILSLILLIITSLIVVAVLASRISLLLNEQTEARALLFGFVNSIYFFDWLSSIGFYVFTNILVHYFKLITEKCDELRAC